MLGWAGLHNGADNDLQQAAANSVEQDGDQQARKSAGQDRRQHRQKDQPQRREAMRQQRRSPIADPINEEHGRAVHSQLQKKIQRNKQRHLRQRNAELFLKGQKQQGNEVIHHRLHNIAGEAGAFGVLVGHGKALLGTDGIRRIITLPTRREKGIKKNSIKKQDVFCYRPV